MTASNGKGLLERGSMFSSRVIRAYVQAFTIISVFREMLVAPGSRVTGRKYFATLRGVRWSTQLETLRIIISRVVPKIRVCDPKSGFVYTRRENAYLVE